MLLLYRGERFNANFYYHAGLDIDHSFFLLEEGKRILLTSRMNKEYAEKKFKGNVIAYSKDPLKHIENLTKGKRLDLDFRGISAHLFARIYQFKKPRDVSDGLSRARMKKSPGELLLLKQAAKASKKILSIAENYFGKTEQALASAIYMETYSKGLRPSFRPIVATGANSAFPHYEPANERIKGLCLVDYGAAVRRYQSDLTRVFFQKKDPRKERMYAKLKHIIQLITDELPNLRTGGDLARYSQKLYKKENLPFPPHSIGHGIGLEVHELPSLSSKSKDLLEGTTFTLEPSVYFPGKFGLRCEEMVHFNGKRARIL
jgi:Xaa-Pro dipeptidase